MKYEANILKRVRQIEEKKGIYYARTDGKLYKTLKIVYVLVWAYTLFMNFMFAAGNMLLYHLNENVKRDMVPIITVAVATAVLIACLVILRFKNKAWTNYTFGIANLLSCAVLFLTYMNIMTDSLGLWGFNYSFYWRHAVPLILLVILAVWLSVIALKADIKTNKLYKKTVENLYTQFNLSNGEESLSEEDWEEFIKNYNP